MLHVPRYLSTSLFSNARMTSTHFLGKTPGVLNIIKKRGSDSKSVISLIVPFLHYFA